MTSIYAAAGTVNITPDRALPLAGSEIRKAQFTRVADLLEANALVLRQNGPPVVLVAADLMFIGEELRSAPHRTFDHGRQTNPQAPQPGFKLR